MESLHVTLHFDESRKADVIKLLEALDLGEGGRLQMNNGNGANIDALAEKWKDQKLSHEELMALPKIEQVAYCRARGGVFAVMKENGGGLTDDDLEDWNRQQFAEQAEWEEEYERRYGRPFPR